MTSASTTLTTKHEAILAKLVALEAAGELVGIFGDVPDEVYNDPRCPGIRSGLIKSIVSKSYSHAMAEKAKQTDDLAFGIRFHRFFLEPDRDTEIQSPSEKLAMMVMSRKLRAHPDVKERMDGARFEVTCFSKCRTTGLTKRCRIDILQVGKCITDLKTARDASRSAFARDAKKYAYRISAAHYVGIWYDLTGQYLPFDFIAAEKTDPHEPAVYRASARSLSLGEEECAAAMRVLLDVKQNGSKAWTGYPRGGADLEI